MENMRAAYIKSAEEWMKSVLAQHGITSARQAEIRTRGQVSYATIQGMLNGKAPGEAIVIKLASAFGEDVPTALRACGYEDMAELWAKRQTDSNAEEQEGYERSPSSKGDLINDSSGEYHPDDVPPGLQKVYGFQGRVYNELPPGKARDRYLDGLLAQAETNLAMLEEKFAAEEAAMKERGKKPAE